MAKGERHGWLRNALADKDLKASDVARAWNVDDALVSRFIKTGNAVITLERLQTLSQMLGIDLNTLSVKLATKPIPPEVLKPPEGKENSIGDVLSNLRAAVDAASAHFAASGFAVHVTIEYNGGAL